MSTTSSKWLKPCPSRPSAHFQLICFTYAGGSGSEYLQWHRNAVMPDCIEIVAVMMPGRSTRFGDAHIFDMKTVVTEITDALMQTGRVCAGGKPFAFYGHSLGCSVALEVQRELRRRKMPQPVHFFAGASSEPSLRKRGRPISELSNSDIKQMLRSMGGTPEEILESEDMMESLVYPVVRADWSVLDSYVPYEEEPFDHKITSIRGTSDQLASEEQQRGWSKHTKDSFELISFPAGHFFLRPCETDLLSALVERITAAGTS